MVGSGPSLWPVVSGSSKYSVIKSGRWSAAKDSQPSTVSTRSLNGTELETQSDSHIAENTQPNEIKSIWFKSEQKLATR